MPKFGSIRSNKSFKSFRSYSYVFLFYIDENTLDTILEISEKLFTEIMMAMNHLVLENMQRLLAHKDCYLLLRVKRLFGESWCGW